MTFKLKPNPTFPAKVEIPVPGGAVQVLEVEFKHLPKKEFAAFNKELLENRGNDNDDKAISLLFGIMHSWNADAELNKENFEQLMENYPVASVHIYSAYVHEIMRAKAGN